MIFGIFHLGGKIIKEKLAEISAQATVEQWNKEIAAMPVWDGIERQIREHNQFYDISQDWYKVGVRFGDDPNKWRNISLMDVKHNREFWSSNLTPANFAKEYFLKRYQENPNWNDHYAEDVFRCLYLWDADGNEIRADVGSLYHGEFIMYMSSYPDPKYTEELKVNIE